jgi:hypothetical protein
MEIVKMTRSEIYEIESTLYEIDYHGFVVIPLEKIYRLLNKGNRAAGTWKALLDVWQNTGHNRVSLRIAELPGSLLLLTAVETEHAKKWAGEWPLLKTAHLTRGAPLPSGAPGSISHRSRRSQDRVGMRIDPSSSIGSALRRARLDSGMSQGDLARC